MNFDLIFARLMKWEGEEYTDDPDDNGGPSKFGISQRSYPGLDIKSLTREDAKKIYYNDYFMNSPFNDITEPVLREKLFDMEVNLGLFKTTEALQRACKPFGMWPAEDGLYGNNTKKCVHDILNLMDGENKLLIALRCEHAAHYRMLITKYPKFKKYQVGWLRRAYN